MWPSFRREAPRGETLTWGTAEVLVSDIGGILDAFPRWWCQPSCARLDSRGGCPYITLLSWRLVRLERVWELAWRGIRRRLRRGPPPGRTGANRGLPWEVRCR